MENSDKTSPLAMEIITEISDTMYNQVVEILFSLQTKCKEKGVEDGDDLYSVLKYISVYYPLMIVDQVHHTMKKGIEKGIHKPIDLEFFEYYFIPEIIFRLSKSFDLMIKLAKNNASENRDFINELSLIAKEEYPNLADLIDENRSILNKYLDKGKEL